MVIYTDLDGTLLDRRTYSWEKAVPAMEKLRREGIPLVFCSAKTRAEQEVYRRRLGIFHPFIVENGGAIFVPQDYFPFPFDFSRKFGNSLVIELGMPYNEIRRLLCEVRAAGGFHFRGYADMTAAEVAAETGLDIYSAMLAKQREYDETLVFDAPDEEVRQALQKMREAGLNVTHGGRFFNVMGASDKGAAVAILSGIYRRMWGEIMTVGIGDSNNDLPMLARVDAPFLVQKRDGAWEDIDLPHLRRVPGIGPEGWSLAIEEVLEGEAG
ncbi:MAG: mannosyl-3-phosphoglycerate phosphatase [Chloroflexi bacterium]|nr:mannosyl-3-phosphoglycerate phosphatase [Chloroflexota bacterium]